MKSLQESLDSSTPTRLVSWASLIGQFHRRAKFKIPPPSKWERPHCVRWKQTKKLGDSGKPHCATTLAHNPGKQKLSMSGAMFNIFDEKTGFKDGTAKQCYSFIALADICRATADSCCASHCTPILCFPRATILHQSNKHTEKWLKFSTTYSS